MLQGIDQAFPVLPIMSRAGQEDALFVYSGLGAKKAQSHDQQ